MDTDYGRTVSFEVPGYAYVSSLNEPTPDGDRVIMARRLLDGGDVVVRIFARPVTSPRDRQRFEHEVAGLKALTDVRYVMPLQDAGIGADGRAYVVAGYCVAGSLQDHVYAVGRLTAVEVRRIGAKLTTALAEVHHREIYHRNITPSNVLLDESGEPALADFGLVALSMSEGPVPSTVDHPFLSPEAFLPELMTAAADIYALGATLYALLAGTTAQPVNQPMAGEHLPELPRVPWPLMAVLRQATALDPRDRFEDATTFRTALLAGA